MKSRKIYEPSLIPRNRKTTTKRGKREYMKVYMALRRHPELTADLVKKSAKKIDSNSEW